MNPKYGQLAQLVRSIGLIIRRLGFKSLTVYQQRELIFCIRFQTTFQMVKNETWQHQRKKWSGTLKL